MQTLLKPTARSLCLLTQKFALYNLNVHFKTEIKAHLYIQYYIENFKLNYQNLSYPCYTQFFVLLHAVFNTQLVLATDIYLCFYTSNKVSLWCHTEWTSTTALYRVNPRTALHLIKWSLHARWSERSLTARWRVSSWHRGEATFQMWKKENKKWNQGVCFCSMFTSRLPWLHLTDYKK